METLSFPVFLESPVFSSSVEKFVYILDVTKEWLKRVSEKNRESLRYIDEITDLQHGANIIGEIGIKTVLDEWYNDLIQGQSDQERRRMERRYNNHKFSNILRFIRNFSQHASEHMSDDILCKYFPLNFKNKTTFIQNVLDKLPTLLIYAWIEEANCNLDVTREPVCFQFLQTFEISLEQYAETNRLCTFTRCVDNECITLQVIKYDDPSYDSLYGTVFSIKEENGKSFLEISRLHNESIKIGIQTPEPIVYYNILFGVHKLHTHLTQNTVLFLRDSNLTDVVKALSAHSLFTIQGEMKAELETTLVIDTTELLRSSIIETGSIEINGGQLSLKSIKTCAENILENLEFSEWMELLINKPLRLFSKTIINDSPVPNTGSSTLNCLIESSKRIQILTKNTALFRTNIVKNLYYELGRRNYVSLFVSMANICCEPDINTGSLKETLINVFSTTELEKTVLENIFGGTFPKVFLLLDGIDKIPQNEFLEFVEAIKDNSIRIVATSENFCSGVIGVDLAECSLREE